MSFQLVTVRARTRGKGPKEFSFQGVGKTTARKVLDKDGEPVKREDGTEIEVDDLDVAGLVTEASLPEVLELYKGDMKSLLESALVGYNVAARSEASPVVEQVTEDELTPMVEAMKAAAILTDKDATTWRRTVTSGAKSVELDRIDFAKMTKEYKALVKTGYKAA